MALKLSGFFQTNVSDMHRGETVSQSTTRIEADKQTQAEVQAKELIPGRAIRGEIVGRNGQEIQIRLAKDVVINARMEQEIQTAAGQNVTFEVRSNTSGVISLRPLFQNMSQENNALKALVQAGLEGDAKGMQMVSAMMQEGMFIGKDALLGMYRQVANVPESEITNIVQMNRLQIPVTPENLHQFEAYKNYEHQLLQAFSEVADELPKQVAGLFAEGRGEEGNALIGRLLSVFDDSGKGSEAIFQENTVLTETAGVLDVSLMPDGQEEAVVTGKDKLAGENTQAELSAALEQLESTVQSEAAVSTEKGELSGKEAAALKSEMASVAEEKSENVQQRVKTLGEKEMLLPEDRDTLASLVKAAGGSAEKVSQMQLGLLGKEAIYQLVKELSEKAVTPKQQEAVKELFVSREFQKIFRGKMTDQWTLDMEEHLEKETVSKLYERLNEQTKQLTKALLGAAGTDSPIIKSVQNVRENVEFMNQLNQLYTYVQLPLKFNKSSAHGDLYVYTNKKNLAKKDGNISAFLHLDMEHLGAVDVYVAMEQSRISTNFYLEDEESLALLEKNMDILTKRLKDKGYRAEAKLMLREQSENVMEEIIKTDRNISMISEQSFDVRA